ncbi:unnamed protein product [Ectocarpus sp. 12 AP-2014]
MLSMNALVASGLLAAFVVQTSNAFVSPSMLQGGVTPRPASSSKFLHSVRAVGVGALRMADGDGDAMSAAEETAKRLKDQAAALRESAAESEAEIRPAVEKENEVKETLAAGVRPEDMPPKQKISDDMQKRLRQELISQGADPNRSAGNPILIVAGIIAVLVIVGGQGIFY